MSSYTAAETRANYDEVEIESILLLADVGSAGGVGFTRSIP
jgi:hypothetical protein